MSCFQCSELVGSVGIAASAIGGGSAGACAAAGVALLLSAYAADIGAGTITSQVLSGGGPAGALLAAAVAGIAIGALTPASGNPQALQNLDPISTAVPHPAQG